MYAASYEPRTTSALQHSNFSCVYKTLWPAPQMDRKWTHREGPESETSREPDPPKPKSNISASPKSGQLVTTPISSKRSSTKYYHYTIYFVILIPCLCKRIFGRKVKRPGMFKIRGRRLLLLLFFFYKTLSVSAKSLYRLTKAPDNC